MPRPYNVLRGLMRERELTNELLARELKLTPCTVSQKLNGHVSWKSDEMWHIMSIFEQPSYRFHEIFPRNGINRYGKEKRDD